MAATQRALPWIWGTNCRSSPPLRPARARPASRCGDHSRHGVRCRGHQLPGPLRQPAGRRCAASGRRRPGRYRRARPGHRGLHPGEPPPTEAGSARPATSTHSHSAQDSRPSRSPTGRAPSCPSPPATWEQRSRPPALPTSPHIRPCQAIAPTVSEPQKRRLRDPRPTCHLDGHGPPDRMTPPPRRGCKPASPTPSPPPLASALSRKPLPGPRAERSGPAAALAPAPSLPSRKPPGSEDGATQRAAICADDEGAGSCCCRGSQAWCRGRHRCRCDCRSCRCATLRRPGGSLQARREHDPNSVAAISLIPGSVVSPSRAKSAAPRPGGPRSPGSCWPPARAGSSPRPGCCQACGPPPSACGRSRQARSS